MVGVALADEIAQTADDLPGPARLADRLLHEIDRLLADGGARLVAAGVPAWVQLMTASALVQLMGQRCRHFPMATGARRAAARSARSAAAFPPAGVPLIPDESLNRRRPDRCISPTASSIGNVRAIFRQPTTDAGPMPMIRRSPVSR